MNKLLLDRRYWFAPIAVWTLAVVVSLVWNLAAIERQILELSSNQGREVFRTIEAMRLWNARHGGVYVEASERTPANSYLEVPNRDLETREGVRLTLLNPAYMTREVARTVSELTGVRIHLTSLQPINPDNMADAWEAAALQDFERGVTERIELMQQGGRTFTRYMAPLLTREECLHCHQRNYRLGEVRGAISVTLPTAPFSESLRYHKRNSILVHLVGWALVAALTLFTLARSRRHILTLAQAKNDQEALVEQRTAELRREVAERHQAETRLRLLVEASGNGIFGLDAHGECTFINPVAIRLLGVESAEAFLGRPILDMIIPTKAHAGKLHEALRLGHSLHSDDYVCQRADGTTFHVEIRLDPIDGAAGGVVNFSDITQRKAAEASIWHQANYDALTGLANRRLFNHRLEQVLVDARRSPEIVALLFVDLDGFKAVNDAFGHEAGDCVLRETALRLQTGIRESDFAARLAGDEFLVILRHLAGEADAGTVAGKLIEALAEPFYFGDQELSVSASIGLAVYPCDGDSASELVKKADLAMYKAKEAGKHTYRYYAAGRFTENWLSTN